MKLPAAWLEVSLVAGGLMVGMLVVMWAQRPGPTCTLSVEAPRQLVLSRETEREHLATEIASADRIARRYMLAEPEQHSRFMECEATLVREIAARHGVSPRDVRASSAAAQ